MNMTKNHKADPPSPSERPNSTGNAKPLSEAALKQELLTSGLMSSLPLASGNVSRPEFHHVLLDGEPLSESILRERR